MDEDTLYSVLNNLAIQSYLLQLMAEDMRQREAKLGLHKSKQRLVVPLLKLPTETESACCNELQRGQFFCGCCHQCKPQELVCTFTMHLYFTHFNSGVLETFGILKMLD